jgi:hypothetical protein
MWSIVCWLGLIVRNYEKLKFKGAEAKTNFCKWFFHRRKEPIATTLHVCRTAENEDDKESYNNKNNYKNKNEQPAEYKDGDKSFFEDVIGYNDIKKLLECQYFSEIMTIISEIERKIEGGLTFKDLMKGVTLY